MRTQAEPLYLASVLREKKSEIPNTERWILYPMGFCKIVIAMSVLLIVVCTLLKIKSKNISNKNRL